MRAHKAPVWLLLLATAVMLAACGGAREPFAESRTPGSLAPRFYPPEGWGWGFLQIGNAPAQRYGVSAPPVTASAQVLILPGYGETAESWFETVRALNDRGYTVWVLEREGQGGSGRFTGSRDIGHAPSFDADVAATRAMLRMIAANGVAAPLVILAQGAAAPVARLALGQGGQADGLILSAPIETVRGGDLRAGQQGRLLRKVGLGGLRVLGGDGWRRDRLGLPGADALDPARAAMQLAWQTTNPDLRMGGPSYGWQAALLDATEAARRVRAYTGPLLVAPARVGAEQLDRDPGRNDWLTAIIGFIEARIAEKQPTPAPHRL